MIRRGLYSLLRNNRSSRSLAFIDGVTSHPVNETAPIVVRICLLTFFLFGIVTFSFAQQTTQDTTAADRVTIDWSETFEIFQEKGTLRRKLTGDVQLRQDSIYLYCDSAIISDQDTRVQAMGSVIIQQGDSLDVFADSLIYSGVTRIANLYGNVALEHADQQLFTDSLRYDLNTKIATYTSGATLVNEETQLSSKRGYYYVDLDEAYFKDSVIVVDPQFNLKADTLKFNVQTEVVTFLGPTLITDDSTKIYTEAGFYDTQLSLAEFTKNAQYRRGEQQARAELIRYNGADEEYSLIGNARFTENDRRATADTIRYDERNDKTFLVGNAHYEDDSQEINAPTIVYDAAKETYSTRGRARISDPPQILEADTVDYSEERGMGIALGNVIWQDTSANLTIRCSQADYDRESDYLKAMGGALGRPLLITEIDGDSLFMASDTLMAIREDTLENDSSRLLLAYHDVRIFKNDMQALCDSLTYNSRDSVFRFYEDPIVWSDTSQFTADTIRMQLKDDKIDRVFLTNKGLIINSSDEIFFNQIKGKDITAFFENDNIDRMEVIGNAEAIYYALDDYGAYIGVNETACSEMMIYWGDNQVETIRFMNQPSGTVHPMGKVNHQELRLDGFRWVKDRRPRSVRDLFDRPPPKKEPPATAKPDVSLREEDKG